MKKILSFLSFFAIMTCLVAQNSAIYKAQAALSENKYAKAGQILDEALRNPKTTKFAEMYNLNAEINLREMNPELIKASQGLPFDTLAFCKYLDNAVSNFSKSNEFDTKPDKKGRVKPKFILKNKTRLMTMLDYYNYAAMFMNQIGKKNKAIEYFQKYLNLPRNPIFSTKETDSIYNSKKKNYDLTAYNLMLLEYQKKDWNKVLQYANYLNGKALSKEQVHDRFLIKMQAELAKNDSTAYLNTLAEAVAETEEPNFMQNLLVEYIKKGDKNAAIQMADNLIKKNPNSKAPYYMRGCVDLNMAPYDYDAARKNFEKALSIDPNFIQANLNMGYCYTNEVVSKVNSGEIKWKRGTDNKSKALYNKIADTVIKPYYKKALPYFEKVKQLAPDQPKLWASALQQVYTNLQMPVKAKAMETFIK